MILKRTTRMLSAFKRAVRVVRALQGFPFFPRRPPSSTRLISSPPPARNAAMGGRTAARGPSLTETVALGPFARPLAHFLPLSLTLVYLPPSFPLFLLPPLSSASPSLIRNSSTAAPSSCLPWRLPPLQAPLPLVSWPDTSPPPLLLARARRRRRAVVSRKGERDRGGERRAYRGEGKD